MDQVTTTKVNFRLEQWKNLIFERQNSGLTVREWCEQNNINQHTYYYYLKRLRARELDKSNTSLVPVEDEKPVAFKKLEVQTPVPNTQAAVIIRLNGATVEVVEGTSQQTIQAVLLALQSVC
ncbi:MAG: IS66 family insertion sequence element accessory protein TnpA [Lachnospira sp.]